MGSKIMIDIKTLEKLFQLQFEEGEIVLCKDGVSRTIEEIIEKQIEI
jgi:hypothetical protein